MVNILHCFSFLWDLVVLQSWIIMILIFDYVTIFYHSFSKTDKKIIFFVVVVALIIKFFINFFVLIAQAQPLF